MVYLLYNDSSFHNKDFWRFIVNKKKKNLPVPIDDMSKALRLEANLDECSVQTSQIKNTPQSTEIFNEIVLMFKNPSLTEYKNVEWVDTGESLMDTIPSLYCTCGH